MGSRGGVVTQRSANPLQIRYPRATHVSRSEISPKLFWDLGPFPPALIPLRSKQSWITEYFGIQKPLVLLGFLHRRVGDPSRIRTCNPRSRKPFVISHFPPINQKLTPSTQSARGFFRDIVRGFSVGAISHRQAKSCNAFPAMMSGAGSIAL
jgi:hypothetical protein